MCSNSEKCDKRSLMATRGRARTERSIVNEVLAFALVALGILIALSLVTYDPRDPSFNVSSTRTEVSNLTGHAGAWIADVLLQMAGLLAFAIPIGLIVHGARGMISGRLAMRPRIAIGIA